MKLSNIILILFLFSCNSNRYLNQIKKEQAKHEYEYWERSQMTFWEKAFGKSKKDPRIRLVENELEASKRKEKREKEEEEILKKVEGIRSRIKE